MTIYKTAQGYEVASIIAGYRVKRHYIGHSKREAVRLFQEENMKGGRV
jgi:hypothetical protein